ncbi:MAG TPA: VCBS repeat-containing protein [Bryobacteraceae bacterium]|nr:VCBS repeat-containing protein [Bryobacteraceae bacterium]
MRASFFLRLAYALTAAASACIGEAAALAPVSRAASSGSGFLFQGTPGVGDFDGDHRTDLVYARPQGSLNGTYRYQVEVRLTAESGFSFAVASGTAGGLRISTRDVDGDQDLDLVITSAFGGLRVGVWINDGHGNFTQGVAESYPVSIWQEPDQAWEAPASADFPAAPFVIPAGNSSIEPARLEMPSLVRTAQTLFRQRKAYHQQALNCGSPLRAPPPSWNRTEV